MKIHKIEIARRQLEAALKIFLEGGDLLAVITLAGAAEEIFGTFVKLNGKVNALHFIEKIDKKITGGRPFKDLARKVNRLRNALKHATDREEDEVEMDERAEAISMLCRAISNYSRVDLVGSIPLTEKLSPYLSENYQ